LGALHVIGGNAMAARILAGNANLGARSMARLPASTLGAIAVATANIVNQVERQER